MKKATIIIMTVLLIATVTGCGKKTAAATFNGLIFSLENNRILVVEGIDSADIPYDEWFQAGVNAIWFTADKKTVVRDTAGKKTNMDALKAGQKVEVIFSGAVAKSYPGQAQADKINIISN